MVNGAQPATIAEWRKMLEETKKEVREIKAIESHLKWNMQREEKKEKLIEAKATVQEIRDWRWKQKDEMQAYAAAKTAEVKEADLKDSKAFQEFKREAKAVNAAEEKKQITEDYVKDRENAQWRAELCKAVQEREKDAVNGRLDDVLEIREIRNHQKEQEKLEADENRAHEQTLEMAAIAREIAKEKEELLENLEFSRKAHMAPPRSYLAPTAVLGQLS